ncbi:hypothetical protein V1477_010754 [Vespula maculifrons]|uniref:Uncharacterized protein n=1 Tax=Vespula maculifrons TaxID=7453 RepID=A0ABD2C2V5_VESMC
MILYANLRHNIVSKTVVNGAHMIQVSKTHASIPLHRITATLHFKQAKRDVVTSSLLSVTTCNWKNKL